MTLRPYLFVLICSCIFNIQNLVGQSVLNTHYLEEIATVLSVRSEILNEDRTVWVQVPENYNPESSLRYPVVYVLDGDVRMSTLATVYENYWGHFLPKMILVGISNGKNRVRDLTPTAIRERNGGPMNMETGGAEKFTDFIEQELIPYIDSNYKTTPYRTLIGHSFAGLFVGNMLLEHPYLFNNYLAIDPSLDWDNQYMLKRADTVFSKRDFKGKSLFVSLGAEQLHMMDSGVTLENVHEDKTEFSLFARSILEFSELAKQNAKGLTFFNQVYPNELHGTVPLPSMRDGLVSIFSWYQFKNPPKYNNPETPLNELKIMIEEQEKVLSEKFGYNVPPMIEEMLVGYGFMFMQTGQIEKASHFFKLGVKHYPESEMTHVSLAEFYESQGDFSNAITQLHRANEIGGVDQYAEKIQELKSKKSDK
jgi:predicted alpha/beta superfamily hydrolase